MIASATRGAGGPQLGAHLADAGLNEEVRPGGSRGLIALDIEDQVAELTSLGSHARTCQPLYHVHADPPPGRPWSEAERTHYWDLFEGEFGLQDRPFASVIHVKHGREHEHRVYLRVRRDGRAIRLDFDFARREKVNRLMEFERGEVFVKGAHNRSVIAALHAERPEVAIAMRAAGLDSGPRPVAPLTPAERLQQERTLVAKADVAAAALAAWQASDSGLSFVAALADKGLALAKGDKCPVVLDASGSTHALSRLLASAAKAAGSDRIAARDVTGRLDGLELPERRAAPATHPTEAPAVAGADIPTESRSADHDHETAIPAAAAASAANPAGDVRPGRPQGAHRREPAARAGSNAAASQGPARDERSRLGDREGGRHGREPHSLARPAGAERGGGERQPADSRPLGSSGGGAGPDGEAPGRTRIQNHRHRRAFSHALTPEYSDRIERLAQELRCGPTPESIAAERLLSARTNIEQVLKTSPWPNARDLEPSTIASKIRQTAENMMAFRHAELEPLRARALLAKAAVPSVNRLVPWMTATERAADEARAAFAERQRHVLLANHADQSSIDEALAAGTRASIQRRREVRDWERKPEIAAAADTKRLLPLVEAAVRNGDRTMICLVVEGGVRLAADEQKRRENADEGCLRRQDAERLRLPAPSISSF